MAYRPDWFIEIADGRSVVEIATLLSSCIRGSNEYLSNEDAENDIRCLKHVLGTWKDYAPGLIGYDFDCSVKALIENAIKMAEGG